AVTHRGKLLINLNYGELFDGCSAYGIHRGDLFTTLHRAACNAGVQFVLKQRVTNYAPTTVGVKLNIDGTSGDDEHVFDFLIAADGASLLSRENSPMPKHVPEYPHGALWAVAPCHSIRGELWQITHHTKTLCGILPMGDNRSSLFWSLRKDEKEALF